MYWTKLIEEDEWNLQNVMVAEDDALFDDAPRPESPNTDGDHGRERVEVCPDCGTFMVYGDKNGVHFNITFTLMTDEMIEAAGAYLRGLRAIE